MKVLQVLPDLNTGGVERGAVELGKELVKQGFSSTVISNGGVLVEALEQSGSVHIQIPVGRKHISTLLWINQLKKNIKKLAPDIIHVRSRMPAWMVHAALLGMPKSKRPVVVSTFHGMYSKPWYSQVMTFSDHIISISQTVTQHILDTYQVNPKKISLIYRGCDQQIFSRQDPDPKWVDKWYSQYPETRDKILLVLPARITKWKGIDTMIELISRLDERFHAVIVGPVHSKKQRYWEALQALVDAKNVTDRVTFTGARTDMAEIYRLAAVVYNLSSKPEPFGRVVCEACNVGTKVVAWASGGPKETLGVMFKQGLVEPGNIDELIDKTLLLADDDTQSPTENPFTTEKTTRETLQLYQRLLFDKAHAITMKEVS